MTLEEQHAEAQAERDAIPEQLKPLEHKLQAVKDELLPLHEEAMGLRREIDPLQARYDELGVVLADLEAQMRVAAGERRVKPAKWAEEQAAEAARRNDVPEVP